jgi:hypothetical protein
MYRISRYTLSVSTNLWFCFTAAPSGCSYLSFRQAQTLATNLHGKFIQSSNDKAYRHEVALSNDQAMIIIRKVEEKGFLGIRMTRNVCRYLYAWQYQPPPSERAFLYLVSKRTTMPGILVGLTGCRWEICLPLLNYVQTECFAVQKYHCTRFRYP